jgi:hypothetical protein
MNHDLRHPASEETFPSYDRPATEGTATPRRRQRAVRRAGRTRRSWPDRRGARRRWKPSLQQALPQRFHDDDFGGGRLGHHLLKCEMSVFTGDSLMEPTGFEPVTSCLQRSPSERAKWPDLLGIPRFPVLVEHAKARFICRDFSGRWSTEAGAWTSSAVGRPRVLLGASDASRR